MKILRILCAAALLAAPPALRAIDHQGLASASLSPDRFTLIENSVPVGIVVDGLENSAVRIAAGNLAADFGRVCGNDAAIAGAPSGKRVIMAGTFDGPTLRALVKNKKVDLSELKGKTEQYIITNVADPAPGVDEALVVAGSDRRGAVYGLYELSEQIGVSPWYDWADVPVERKSDVSIARGRYTAGEPAVRYRGLFSTMRHLA